MFCTNCGQGVPPEATACPNCGRPVHRPAPPQVAAGAPVAAPPQVIPNYLVQSILVTFCCCLPFGIPAIVYAAQVNPKVAAGDVAGALASSKNAKMWSWISFGAGALIGVVYGIAVVLGFVAEQ